MQWTVRLDDCGAIDGCGGNDGGGAQPPGNDSDGAAETEAEMTEGETAGAATLDGQAAPR